MMPNSLPEPLPELLIAPIVRAALAEDLGRAGDVTAQACIPAEASFTAVFASRKAGVIAGLDCARLAMLELDPRATFAPLVADGAVVAPGAQLAKVDANARALLSAERTGLNLLGRLSGIATLTNAYVQAVAGTRARIVDTRKTTPGLRALEKYAVRCGGGVNHRMSLSDAALVKDNHVVAAGGVAEAFARVRTEFPDVDIEVEVDTLHQVREVLDAGADLILLDNFTPAETAEAVTLVAGRARLESSGRLTLANARAYAETGVDFLAVGALTHSAAVLDIGLDLRAEA
jgi:nicotinate-nucleotide pyrophosphorylase (carboxylating)